MYADIVVLTYQAPDIGIFTYEIPEDLESKIAIGQLVEVPFGKRTPQGIVVAVKSTKPPNIDVRPIARLSLDFPLLLPYQVELVKWMAKYYHAPIVNCLETILPEIPKRLPQDTRYKILDTKYQTIVLLPSINRLPETLAQFPQAKNYLQYHNQLKTSEKFQNWIKAIKGETDFIFGSRLAIFVPCPNLKKIIIFDEHDSAYKDERSPYYDTLCVAEKIASTTGAKIEIHDASPKITTFYTHKNDIKISPPKNKVLTHTISMALERKAGNKSPISDLLKEEIVKNYKKGGKTLLFLNKKIESGQFYCRNCAHQTYVKIKPDACPNCKSPDLLFYSLNIATLANTVRTFLPSVPIKFIAEGVTSALANSQVIIATSSIFYALSYTKYDIIAHVAVDNVANIPDFISAEKTYCQISNLKKLVKNQGILILQTYNPQSYVIRSAANSTYSEFARSHLDERKALLYPPFALMVKLSIKEKLRPIAQAKANELFSRLSQLPDIASKKVIILGPYQPFFASPRPIYNIILKKPISSYSLEKRQEAVDQLSEILNQIPKEWQKTIEPDSLN